MWHKKPGCKKIWVLLLAVGLVMILSGCASMQSKYEKGNALIAKGEYQKAAEAFETLGGYEDAPQLVIYCRAMAAGEEGKYQDCISTLENLGQFKDAPMQLNYYRARSLEATGALPADDLQWYDQDGWTSYFCAADIYGGMPLFRDCTARSEACYEAVYARALALGGQNNYNAAIEVLATLGPWGTAATQADYYAACNLSASGYPLLAADQFDLLGEYADAPEKAAALRLSVYENAENYMAEGKFGPAYQIFSSLGDYSHERGDAATRAKDAAYRKGESFITGEERDYDEAREAFFLAGDYVPQDGAAAAERIKECWYLEGQSLLACETPEYENAKLAFEKAGDYSDAATAFSRLCYQKGEALLQQENPAYAAAREAFFLAGDYVPQDGAAAADRIKECWYLEGQSLLACENPDYENAKLAFEKAGDYSDAATAFIRLCYEKGEALLQQENPAYAAAREAFGHGEGYVPQDGAAAADRIKECWYLEGQSLLACETPEYENAKLAFEKAGDYSDAATAFSRLCYQKGEALLQQENPDYAAAREAFGYAEGYTPDGGTPASDRIKECWYLEGQKLLEEERYFDAYNAFALARDYRDSARQRETLETTVLAQINNSFSAGENHTLLLNSDGTVLAAGKNSNGQCEVTDWENIIAISAGESHSAGIRSDGTVAAAGPSELVEPLSAWTGIVKISAGKTHTLGLRSDGTVLAAGKNDFQKCDVETWTDIVQIATGDSHSVGLRADGTVVAAGSNDHNRCDVSHWMDIVDVDAGMAHTVGLRGDGRVFAIGSNIFKQCRVSEWTDIIAVSAGANHTVGLRSDGTVVATGNNLVGQCNVENWTGIVAVSAGGNHTIGRKSDGTYVVAGGNSSGQCDLPGVVREVAPVDGTVAQPATPSAVNNGEIHFSVTRLNLTTPARTLCATAESRRETTLLLVEELAQYLGMPAQGIDYSRLYIGRADNDLYVVASISEGKVAVIHMIPDTGVCYYSLRNAVPGQCVKIIQEYCMNNYWKVIPEE